MLNICIDSSSRSSSRTWNLSYRYLQSSRLNSLNMTWKSHCWSFSLAAIIWIPIDSSSITLDKIKSKSCKVILELQFTLYLTILSKAVSIIFNQASHFCVPSSFFYFSRKVTSKNFPLRWKQLLLTINRNSIPPRTTAPQRNICLMIGFTLISNAKSL